MDRPRDVLQGQFQLETEKRHEYSDVKEIMDARSQTLCIDGESATAFVRWAQRASKSGKSDGSEVVRKEMIKDMLSYTDLTDVEKNCVLAKQRTW